MKITVEPMVIAELLLAGRTPLREVVTSHGGAVTVSTVARCENDWPDLPKIEPVELPVELPKGWPDAEPNPKPVNRQQVQVSGEFLERLHGEIEADKRQIARLRQAVQYALKLARLNLAQLRDEYGPDADEAMEVEAARLQVAEYDAALGAK